MSYRGACCRICSTMHDFAELNHAKFTQPWPYNSGCRCHRTSSIFHFNAGLCCKRSMGTMFPEVIACRFSPLPASPGRTESPILRCGDPRLRAMIAQANLSGPQARS
jgi:hypothetical protein